MPILFKVPQLAKVLGVPYVPVTATCWRSVPPASSRTSRPSSSSACSSGPLRRSARSDRVLAQQGHGRVREHPGEDPGRALRHAAHAPIGLVRLMGRRVLVTGLGTFWGGASRRPSSSATTSTSSSASTARSRHRAAAHRVRAQRRELLDPLPHREGHEGRHDRAHVPRRRLDRDARPHDARDQRHRHDEPVRRGVGAPEARCATSS